MKKIYLIVILVFVCLSGNSQVRMASSLNFGAKEFSKEISLYKSKDFLMKNVLKLDSLPEKFEVIPLAASGSGELTTLLYKCDNKKKEGMILGFYGDYWNESGVLYQGYAFKNLERDTAIEFLDRITSAINKNIDYLQNKNDHNNIAFTFNDIEILIWSYDAGYTIRLFWEGFDATWEKTSYERSRKRFQKKLKQ